MSSSASEAQSQELPSVTHSPVATFDEGEISNRDQVRQREGGRRKRRAKKKRLTNMPVHTIRSTRYDCRQEVVLSVVPKTVKDCLVVSVG
jgi:hypothetical protein